MAHQYAAIDPNKRSALLGHSGTSNAAETRRITSTALGSKIGIDAYVSGGTISTNVVDITGFNGGTVAVGTVPVELTFTGITQGIMVTADHNNGTAVYIGGAAVAQDGDAAITSLWPGESVSVDLNDASTALYVIGGTVGQKVYKVALT